MSRFFRVTRSYVSVLFVGATGRERRGGGDELLARWCRGKKESVRKAESDERMLMMHASSSAGSLASNATGQYVLKQEAADKRSRGRREGEKRRRKRGKGRPARAGWAVGTSS